MSQAKIGWCCDRCASFLPIEALPIATYRFGQIGRPGNKQSARINMIKDLLFRLDYKGKDETLVLSDANIVFNYEESYLHNGMIAP